MNKLKALTISIILLMVLSLAGPALDVSARPLAHAPPLGAAASFSILSYSGVTNTNSSSTSGDVGVSPGPSCGPPVGLTIGGAPHFCDLVAASAQADADTARLHLESHGPGTTLGSNLTGEDLVAGVYTVPGVSILPGELILRGPGRLYLPDGRPHGRRHC